MTARRGAAKECGGAQNVVPGPAHALRLVIPGRLDAQVRTALWNVLDRHEVDLFGVRAVDPEEVDVLPVRPVTLVAAPDRCREANGTPDKAARLALDSP